MGDRDWGRWQVILAIIAIAIALIGLVFQLEPTTPETPSETPTKTQTSTVTTGSISVSSSPVGASVYLDGNYEGEVPQFLNDIEQGMHSITLKLEGYEDWYEDISIDADKTISVSPTLTPSPEPSPEPSSSTGSISVTSSPTGADIFLDDTYEGETPKILEDVKQGSHTVTLTLAEYENWSKAISVEADKTVSVSPTLTPSPEPSEEPSENTSVNFAFISDSENVKTPTLVDISPYLDWSFTTSEYGPLNNVPEGSSYVTVTIHT